MKASQEKLKEFTESMTIESQRYYNYFLRTCKDYDIKTNNELETGITLMLMNNVEACNSYSFKLHSIGVNYDEFADSMHEYMKKTYVVFAGMLTDRKIFDGIGDFFNETFDKYIDYIQESILLMQMYESGEI